MLARLLSSLLNRLLSQYVVIDSEQLQTSVWNGLVHLTNLTILPTVLDVIQLPIQYKLLHGKIGTFTLTINWARLATVPTTIVCTDIYLLVQSNNNKQNSILNDISVQDAIDYINRNKQQLLHKLLKQSIQSFTNNSTVQQWGIMSYATNWLGNIVDNLQIEVKRVHIQLDNRFDMTPQSIHSATNPLVNQPYTAGILLQRISVHNSNQQGTPIKNQKNIGIYVHKKIDIYKLAIYCNTGDSSKWCSNYASELNSYHQSYIHHHNIVSDIELQLLSSDTNKLNTHWYLNPEIFDSVMSLPFHKPNNMSESTDLHQASTILHYILHPLDINTLVTLNKSLQQNLHTSALHDQHENNISCTIKINSILIDISSLQLQHINKLTDELTYIATRLKHAPYITPRYKPTHSRDVCRQWWRYCISIIHTRSKKKLSQYTWNSIKQHRYDFKRYIPLYQAKLHNELLLPGEQNDMVAIENHYSIQRIILWRTIIDNIIKLNTAISSINKQRYQQTNNTWSSWATSFISNVPLPLANSPTNMSNSNIKHTMQFTQEERNQLRDLLGHDIYAPVDEQNDNSVTNTDTNQQSSPELHVDINISNISLRMLHNDITSNERIPFIQCFTRHISINATQTNIALDINVQLNDMYVQDKLATANRFTYLLKSRAKNNSNNKKSSTTSATPSHTAPYKQSYRQNETTAVQARLHYGVPINRTQQSSITCSITVGPLDCVYNDIAIQRIVSFIDQAAFTSSDSHDDEVIAALERTMKLLNTSFHSAAQTSHPSHDRRITTAEHIKHSLYNRFNVEFDLTINELQLWAFDITAKPRLHDSSIYDLGASMYVSSQLDESIHDIGTLQAMSDQHTLHGVAVIIFVINKLVFAFDYNESNINNNNNTQSNINHSTGSEYQKCMIEFNINNIQTLFCYKADHLRLSRLMPAPTSIVESFNIALQHTTSCTTDHMDDDNRSNANISPSLHNISDSEQSDMESDLLSISNNHTVNKQSIQQHTVLSLTPVRLCLSMLQLAGCSDIISSISKLSGDELPIQSPSITNNNHKWNNPLNDLLNNMYGTITIKFDDIVLTLVDDTPGYSIPLVVFSIQQLNILLTGQPNHITSDHTCTSLTNSDSSDILNIQPISPNNTRRRINSSVTDNITTSDTTGTLITFHIHSKFFYRELSCWETMIEQWSCTIKCTHNTITLTTTDMLNILISHQSIDSLMYIMQQAKLHVLKIDHTDIAHYQRQTATYFRIRNDLGVRVRFWPNELNQSNTSHKQHGLIVSVGDEIVIPIRQQTNRRITTMRVSEYDAPSIVLQVERDIDSGDWVQWRNINDIKLIDVKHQQSITTHTLIPNTLHNQMTTSTSNLHKPAMPQTIVTRFVSANDDPNASILVISSPVTVSNKTLLSLSIQLIHTQSKQCIVQYTAQPGQQLNLPLISDIDHKYIKLYVKPCDGVYMSANWYYSTDGIRLSLLHSYTQCSGTILQCNYDSVSDNQQFNIRCCIDKHSTTSTDIDAYTIRFESPLVISNVIGCSIQYELILKQRALGNSLLNVSIDNMNTICTVSGTLPHGGETQCYGLDLSTSTQSIVTIRIKPCTSDIWCNQWSEYSVIYSSTSLIITNDTLSIYDIDQRELPICIDYNFIEQSDTTINNTNLQYMIALYVPYWIINKSQLQLVYSSIDIDSSTNQSHQLCAGQSELQINTDKQRLQCIRESVITSKQQQLQHTTAQYNWSYFTEVRTPYIKHQGVDVLTSDHTVLHNSTDYPFLLSYDVFDAVCVDSTQLHEFTNEPVHNAKSHTTELSQRRICIRLPNSEWSQPFNLDTVNYDVAVQCIESLNHNKHTVHTASDDNTVYAPRRLYELSVRIRWHNNINLRSRTKLIELHPRYIFVNQTPYQIQYRQLTTEHINTIHAHQQHAYHWADSTAHKLICIRFNGVGWIWSAYKYGFQLDSIGWHSIRIRNNQTHEWCILHILIKNLYGTLYVTFVSTYHSSILQSQRKQQIVQSQYHMNKRTPYHFNDTVPITPIHTTRSSINISSDSTRLLSPPPYRPPSPTNEHYNCALNSTTHRQTSFSSIHSADTVPTPTHGDTNYANTTLAADDIDSQLTRDLHTDIGIDVPYQIDNMSLHTIEYQQDCDCSIPDRIKPYNTMPYALDEPLGKKQLILYLVETTRVNNNIRRGNLSNTEHSLQQDEIRYRIGVFKIDHIHKYSVVTIATNQSLINHNTHNTLYKRVQIEIIPHGRTRVIRITDAEYYQSNHQTNISKHVPASTDTTNQAELPIITLDIQLSGINCSLITQHKLHDVNLITDYQRYELLNITVNDIRLRGASFASHDIVQCAIARVQIDNQLHSTIYPVLFAPAVIQVNHNSNITWPRPISISSASDLPNNVLFALSMSRNKLQSTTNLLFIDHVVCRIQRMQLKLDEQIIIEFMKFMEQMIVHQSSDTLPLNNSRVIQSRYIANNKDIGTDTLLPYITTSIDVTDHSSTDNELYPSDEIWSQPLILDNPLQLYIAQLSISEIDLLVSYASGTSSSLLIRNDTMLPIYITSLFRAVSATLFNFDNATIRLAKLINHELFVNSDELVERIVTHYSRSGIAEIYKILGSSDILGNPVGLYTAVRSGIYELLYQPIIGLSNGSISGFSSGLLRGTIGLIQYSLFGLADTSSKMMSSISKGVNTLTNTKYNNINARMKYNTTLKYNRQYTNHFMDYIELHNKQYQLNQLINTSLIHIVQPVSGVTDVVRSGITGGMLLLDESINIITQTLQSIRHSLNPFGGIERVHIPKLFDYAQKLNDQLPIQLCLFMDRYLNKHTNQIYYCYATEHATNNNNNNNNSNTRNNTAHNNNNIQSVQQRRFTVSNTLTITPAVTWLVLTNSRLLVLRVRPNTQTVRLPVLLADIEYQHIIDIQCDTNGIYLHYIDVQHNEQNQLRLPVLLTQQMLDIIRQHN